MGSGEILVILLIALVVLGPEKLPKLAADVGRWVGRARAMARQLRAQLDQEVQLEEVRREQSRATTPPPVTPAPPEASPVAQPSAPVALPPDPVAADPDAPKTSGTAHPSMSPPAYAPTPPATPAPSVTPQPTTDGHH